MSTSIQGDIMQKVEIRDGLLKRAWERIGKAGLLFTAGAFLAGIAVWGAFNWSLELSNTEAFCISCHEMKENVFKEYQNTIHYQNRTGIRATCPDCHVPKEWVHKMIRKIQASNELWHKALGSVDTPEKFNAKRIALAQNEWKRMKDTDSRECRNCHHYDSMDYAEQGRRAAAQHQKGFGENKTCIECHKGIAHSLPPIEQNIGAPKVSGTAGETPPSPASVTPKT